MADASAGYKISKGGGNQEVGANLLFGHNCQKLYGNEEKWTDGSWGGRALVQNYAM